MGVEQELALHREAKRQADYAQAKAERFGTEKDWCLEAEAPDTPELQAQRRADMASDDAWMQKHYTTEKHIDELMSKLYPTPTSPVG